MDGTEGDEGDNTNFSSDEDVPIDGSVAKKPPKSVESEGSAKNKAMEDDLGLNDMSSESQGTNPRLLLLAV